MVQNLCKEYSLPLLSLPNALGELETYHPFPPPSVLAAPEVATRLRALGFGYRADFIQKTAKMLVDAHGEDPAAADRWLGELRTRPTNEAREELLKFMGVGRKVADCVLLMSLDKVRRYTSRKTSTNEKITARSHPCRHPRPPDSCQALRLEGGREVNERQSPYDAEDLRRGEHQARRHLGRICWLGALGKVVALLHPSVDQPACA